MGSFLTKHEHIEHSFDNFYKATANNIDGEPVDFSVYKNKVVICVNVAPMRKKANSCLQCLI